MSTASLSGRSSDRVEWPEALAQARGGDAAATTNDSSTIPTPYSAVASTVRPRLTQSRLAVVVDRLDVRDLAVTADVSCLRMLTGGQLERLHFSDVPSADRQARRALARLVDLDVLCRLERQVGGRRAGSAGFVYALGLAGQRLAGGRGPAGGSRVERPWTSSSLYLRHLLLVGEVFVQAKEAERLGRLDVLDFEAEPACWRPFMGPAGRALTLKADAFVRVGVGDVEHLHFLEVDCATESPTTLGRKLDRYGRYVASGIEQERWGTMPRVTWLVPDARRAAVVSDVCSRQPFQLHGLFRVALISRAIDALVGEQQ